MSLQVVADVCKRCKRTLSKHSEGDSSDMLLIIVDTSILFLRELRSGEVGRPWFPLQGVWCPNCLIADLTEWVEKVR